LAALELGRRRFNSGRSDRAVLRTSEDVIALLAPRLAGLSRERFFAVSVDVKNRVLSVDEIARGSSDSVVFGPKELFSVVLARQAHGVICAHNHPSGDPAPSAEDAALTARLADGARILGLRFLDHLILGESGRFYSFADAGRLG
jgi:DNA repair protein RadC